MLKIKRIIADQIDYFICLIVLSPLDFLSKTFIYYMIAMALIMFKDTIFNNKGIGKSLLNLEIVSYDGTKITIVKTILRNITVIIWPVEAIMIVLFNKRIGDIIFKTKVVESSN